MNNAEAVNWLINITADIGKIEHQDLWHYEQALSEIREMLEDAPTIEPSAQPEDYTELKREFLRMASYIDVLLECSDEQKETLIGFISRLSEYMPWTERD